MPKLYPFIDNHLNCIPWLKNQLAQTVGGTVSVTKLLCVRIHHLGKSICWKQMFHDVNSPCLLQLLHIAMEKVSIYGWYNDISIFTSLKKKMIFHTKPFRPGANSRRPRRNSSFPSKWRFDAWGLEIHRGCHAGINACREDAMESTALAAGGCSTGIPWSPLKPWRCH